MEISDWCHVMVAGRVAVSSAPEPLLAEQDFGALYLGARPSAREPADTEAADSEASDSDRGDSRYAGTGGNE